jgi:hypothetical protein
MIVIFDLTEKDRSVKKGGSYLKLSHEGRGLMGNTGKSDAESDRRQRRKDHKSINKDLREDLVVFNEVR